MAPLGILLLIEHERGTYAIAGLVTGAYALGSAAGTPLWGRLMDRFGQVPILLPTSLGSAGLLASLALCTVGGAPTPVLLACSVAAGLTYPPISPAIRSAYRIILPDPAARRVAFALDATSVELLFVGGPLLLSVLLALTPPVAPLLVTAGFMAGGGVAYCRTDAARRWRPGIRGARPAGSSTRRSPLRRDRPRGRCRAGRDADAEHRLRSAGHVDGRDGRRATRRHRPGGSSVRRHRGWQHDRGARLRHPPLALRRAAGGGGPARPVRRLPGRDGDPGLVPDLTAVADVSACSSSPAAPSPRR